MCPSGVHLHDGLRGLLAQHRQPAARRWQISSIRGLPGGPQLTELTKLEDTVPYVRFTAVPSCCIARMQSAAMNASNIAYSARSCAASSQNNRRIHVTRQDLFLHHPSRYELGLQDLLSDVSAHSADHPTQ